MEDADSERKGILDRHCPESAEQRAAREAREAVVAAALAIGVGDRWAVRLDMACAALRAAEAALAKAGR